MLRNILLVCMLLLAACGGEATPGRPPPDKAAAPAARWRVLRSTGTLTVVALQCETPCRLRFRVEGANDIPHT